MESARDDHVIRGCGALFHSDSALIQPGGIIAPEPKTHCFPDRYQDVVKVDDRLRQALAAADARLYCYSSLIGLGRSQAIRRIVD